MAGLFVSSLSGVATSNVLRRFFLSADGYSISVTCSTGRRFSRAAIFSAAGRFGVSAWLSGGYAAATWPGTGSGRCGLEDGLAMS